MQTSPSRIAAGKRPERHPMTADHLRAELVVEALQMAVTVRRPAHGMVHHSDQGCQRHLPGLRPGAAHQRRQPSMGTAGDCFDNPLAESFFATLQTELLDRHHRSDRSVSATLEPGGCATYAPSTLKPFDREQHTLWTRAASVQVSFRRCNIVEQLRSR